MARSLTNGVMASRQLGTRLRECVRRCVCDVWSRILYQLYRYMWRHLAPKTGERGTSYSCKVRASLSR